MFLQKSGKLQNFSDFAGWPQIGMKNETKFEKNQAEISNLKNIGLKKLV